MKRIRIVTILYFFTIQLAAQDVKKSYSYSDGYSIVPKSIIELPGEKLIPYSITKNTEKKAGIIFMQKDNTIKDMILFQGDGDYVINDVIKAADGNLLVSAEGYSKKGQESLYFLEINNGKIVSDFVFNEGGNELDPFAILEKGRNILIGGFVKSRKLISNSFYNMYSEKQMIYVGEFTKSGGKIWSKGIDLDGYEKGVCNSMLKVEDGFLMLCHANKIGENMSPFLIKIDNKGNVKNITHLYHNKFITRGSVLQISDDFIELIGSYSVTDKHCLFSAIFSSDLVLVKSSEYQVPYRLIINGITNEQNIYGAVLKGEGGYNNAIIRKENDGYSFVEFGTSKSDFTIGLSGEDIFSYSISSSKKHTSTFNLLNNNMNLNGMTLKKGENKLKTNYEFKINYHTSFKKSNINTGVGKLRIVNVLSSFKREL